MSQTPETAPVPLSDEGRTIVEALADMLGEVAEDQDRMARERRSPSSYREADAEDLAAAAAADAVSDALSSIEHRLRTRFGLDDPNDWATMWGQKR